MVATERGELIQVARAIRDELTGELPSRDDVIEAARAVKDEMVKRLEAAEKRLTDRFDAQVKSLERSYLSQLRELLSNWHPSINVAAPNVNLSPTLSLAEAMQPPQVTVNIPESTINVAAPSVSVTPTLSLADALPAPQVTVHVPDQPPATVNFSVPDGAVRVDVHQQPSIVNVPEGSIRVDVSQPEALEVRMPKRKQRVEKSIVYGPTGRPDKIVEETTEE